LVPIPFVDDIDVVPAKGETWSEVRSNRRIRELVSVKRAKLPEGAMVMPAGDFKYAFVPTPSPVPPTPARPARVVTTPVDMMICRSKWLPVSTNKAKLPFDEIQMPDGELNEALVPIPSEDPTLLPANTLTSPDVTTTWRIMWLLESATRA
jgi:hypothetical protein